MKRTAPHYIQHSEPSPAASGLADEQIEDVLRNAFAPHRCVVRFQRDAFVGCTKLALCILVSHVGAKLSEQEFLVEGVPVDLLRQGDALSDYINDVRRQLRQRKVLFAAALTPGEPPTTS